MFERNREKKIKNIAKEFIKEFYKKAMNFMIVASILRHVVSNYGSKTADSACHYLKLAAFQRMFLNIRI